MNNKNCLALTFLSICCLADAQDKSLDQFLCQLPGSASITIQQRGLDGQAVPFDCIHTDIKLFEKGQLVNHIKPGSHWQCPYILKKKDTMPIGVWGNQTGVYDIHFTKGEDAKQISGLVIKSKVDDPCEVEPVKLSLSW